MNIKKSLQQRVIVGLEKGQSRIRCLESEYEDAVRFGIVDPENKDCFVMAFNSYLSTRGGFFATFSEKFRNAARKTWKFDRKEGR